MKILAALAATLVLPVFPSAMAQGFACAGSELSGGTGPAYCTGSSTGSTRIIEVERQAYGHPPSPGSSYVDTYTRSQVQGAAPRHPGYYSHDGYNHDGAAWSHFTRPPATRPMRPPAMASNGGPRSAIMAAPAARPVIAATTHSLIRARRLMASRFSGAARPQAMAPRSPAAITRPSQGSRRAIPAAQAQRPTPRRLRSPPRRPIARLRRPMSNLRPSMNTSQSRITAMMSIPRSCR